jgi:hypothetical protein
MPSSATYIYKNIEKIVKSTDKFLGKINIDR